MSFGRRASLTVNVHIPAADALFLVGQISFLLLKAKEWQEKHPDSDLATAAESGDIEARVIQNNLRNLKLTDDVNLSIFPDQRSPKSTDYGIYTTPE